MFDTEKFICEVEARPALYNVKSKEYSNREVKAMCWNQIAKEMYEDWESPELTPNERDERVKDLMKKWKTLRDSFVKDHKCATATGTGKAASSKKRYVYYEQLQFILPYVKGNPSTGSNIPPPVSSASDDVSVTNEMTEQDNVPQTQNSDGPSTSNNVCENAVDSEKRSNKRKFESPNVVAGKRVALEKSIANSAKELTNILATSLQMQREEKYVDKYGHKAFLLSLLPVLDNMPFQQAMITRGQITKIITDKFDDNEAQSRSYSSLSSAPRTPGSDVTSDETEEFSISKYLRL